jgi:addiction module HigA family antidote
MAMHNPPHPGRLVRRTLIEGTGLTITKAAEALGVGRVTLSNVVNEHTGISPEMAVRLSIALNTSSEMWMNMQAAYDLWQAQRGLKSIMKQVTIINKHDSKHLTPGHNGM